MANTTSLTVLQLNDSHAYCDLHQEIFWKGGQAVYRPAGGYARIAAIADELVTRAEEFLPGLRVHIEVQEAASPLTYERYTRNWQGATTGWNWDPQLAPRFKLPKDLPLKQFHAVGHYVFNPGGVPTAMITAWYITREILQKENLS